MWETGRDLVADAEHDARSRRDLLAVLGVLGVRHAVGIRDVVCGICACQEHHEHHAHERVGRRLRRDFILPHRLRLRLRHIS